MVRTALVLVPLLSVGCIDRLEDTLGDTFSALPSTAPDALPPVSGPPSASWGGGAFPYEDEIPWTAPSSGLMWGEAPGVGSLDAVQVDADASVDYAVPALNLRFRYQTDAGDEVILLATHDLWDSWLEPGTVLRVDSYDGATLIVDEDRALSEEWTADSALIEVEERAPGLLRLTLFAEFQRAGRFVASTDVVPDWN